MRGFVVALSLFVSCLAPVHAAEPIPVSAFFSRPKLAQAALSPSGRWIAVTAPAGTGRLSLAVTDTEGKSPPAVIATFSNVDVIDFQWVNDDRLLFWVSNLLAGPGEERDSISSRHQFSNVVYAIKRDGTEQRQLARTDDRYRHEFVMHAPRGRGDTIVLGEAVYGLRGDIDVVNAIRVNIATGRRESLSAGRPAHAMAWLFDAKDEPRAIVTEFGGQSAVYWRDRAGSDWREVARYDYMKPTMSPLAVDGDSALYVTAPTGPERTEVLTRFDIATGKLDPKPLLQAPGFDIRPGFVRTVEGRILGARILTETWSTVWYDAAMKRIQAAADARFPGRVNTVSCGDCGRPDIVLVNSQSDQDPGSIWLFRPSTDSWQLIGRRRPDIDPKAMATLDFRRIKARDGRDLPVWITTPAGGARNAPTVVLVHGGPQSRGQIWGWDRDAQFLASRGYVVIEPEFRGSEGYGAEHAEAGWRHWGDTMQDDNADALAWAVQQGLSDPKRACIAGASYGGYATLMSLIRNPSTYRCGVAWVAVTDPRLMFEETWENDLSTEGQRVYLPALLGDPATNGEELHHFSPAERAREIKAPVLMAFGRVDRRVPIEHGNRMRAAMTAAGNKPEWIVYEDEGHGWKTVEHNVDFWTRVEAFLAQQLK